MTSFLPLFALSAQELFKLLRLQSGHPNQEGYPYTRMELLDECSSRGKRLLQDLRWPADLDAPYWSWRCADHKPERLRNILRPWRWNGFKNAMYNAEQVLVAKGVLPDWVGLSCWGWKEFQAAVVAHPELREEIVEAVRLNKGFYERCIGLFGRSVPISKFKKNQSECEYNVARQARFLGLNVDVMESLESLPKPTNYAGVWAVVEDYTPECPSAEAVRVAKTRREFEKLKRKARNEQKKFVQAPLACFEGGVLCAGL